MATIKPIGGSSVHQIQSGQVIVDLCSVVKELLENSLDAGATSIEVRFKNQGLDSIEIQDNGGGISSEDYETIALKHYTSKLSSYDDLSSLTTFGFRGEAISSLCALSKFHILTATEKEAPKGKRLDFDTSGKLKATGVAASPRGTSVAVEDLFYNLPVRRRELERNIKREYGKVLNTLYAYACINALVRFSVTNQPPKGKKTQVFSTKSNATTKENIANVFGAKALLGLISLDLEMEMSPTTSHLVRSSSTKHNSASQQIRISGHVSRPVFGEGRQAPDRQMFFVNSRPCDLPQIAKVFNEVYKSYNMTQSPFILADLKIDTNAYDVNVSPDKRTILLHDQSALLQTLRESLDQLFQNQDQTVPQSQLYSKQLPSFRPITINNHIALTSINEDELPEDKLLQPEASASASTLEGDSDVFNSSDSLVSPENNQFTNLIHKFAGRNVRDRQDLEAKKPQPPDPSLKKQLKSPMDGLMLRSQKKPAEDNEATYDEEEASYTILQNKPRPVEDFNARVASQQPRADVVGDHTPPNSPPTKKRKANIDSESENHGKIETKMSRFAARLHGFTAPGTQVESPTIPLSDEAKGEYLNEDTNHANLSPDSSDEHDGLAALERQFSSDDRSEEEISDTEYIDEEERKKRDAGRIQEVIRQAEAAAAQLSSSQNQRIEKRLRRSTDKESTVSLSTYLSTSLQEIKTQLSTVEDTSDATMQNLEARAPGKEEPPPSKATAEERLSLTISKSDFEEMRIVGQFNLGFILTTRKSKFAPGNKWSAAKELFIIDQHASDEIYNFSRLALTTTLTPQPLVRPQSLELSAVDEETVLRNTDTLVKNGFNVSIDESGDSPVGHRCSLLTLPTSRETVFDMRDLEELIALLAESGPSSNNFADTRPSRVRKMLAMRACRSSVMVGKSLTKKGMTKVVRHMGQIDRPWNCPHGRPTMRHLASLDEWKPWNETDGLVDESNPIPRETNWLEYLQRCREDESDLENEDGMDVTSETAEFDVDSGGEDERTQN